MADENWNTFVVRGDEEWPLTPRTRFVVWYSVRGILMGLDLDLSRARDFGVPVADIAADKKPYTPMKSCEPPMLPPPYRSPSESLVHGAAGSSVVLNEFPVSTRQVSLEWWQQVEVAAARVEEAMRTGKNLRPRTVAEEAIVYLACEEDWIGAAWDSIDGDDRRAEVDSLPASEVADDFAFDEVLGYLAGDIDVELLWRDDLDGVGDPADDQN